ncbi:MAG: extracellular solute-binding protein [Roseburia sp.]|nr:extracellular solute-binding protein [Roseburia sp.]
MNTKVIIGYLCFIFMFCICGCGSKEEKKEPATVLSTQEQEQGWEYALTYQDFFIPEDIPGFCNVWQMTEDAFYFSASNHSFCDFYTVLLGDREPVVVKLPMHLAEDEYNEGFYVCEDGGYLLCHYKAWNQRFFLSAYDAEGALLWENDITEYLPESERAEGGRIYGMVQDAQGNIYLKGAQNILIFAKDGESRGTIAAPFSYIMALVRSGEGKIYALSDIDIDAVIPVSRLAELNVADLSSGMERTITGSQLTTGRDGGICFFDTVANEFVEYYPDDDSAEKIFALTQYNISSYGVTAFYVGENALRFIFWEEQNPLKPMEIVTLTRPENGEMVPVSEKEKITLISLNNDYDLMYKVQAFNRKNSAYHVELEFLSEGGVYNHDELLEKLNTGMVSGRADLILLGQRDYCSYKEQKVFENLIPYLAGSSIKEEEYRRELVEPLKNGDELYTLPAQFVLQGYALKKDSLEDKEIHTMEDFLDYLEDNPESRLQWGGGKHWVLEVCMKFGWERFVDLERGECYFDGDAFKTLMRRIKALNLEMKSYDEEEWERLAADGENVIPELYLSSLSQFAEAENYYNSELFWLGYPGAGDDNETYALVNSLLCISAKSEHKEGAFAFWEFYMKSKESDAGAFPAKITLFDKQMRDAFGEEDGKKEEKEAALEERRQQTLSRALDTLRTDSPEEILIQNIILEEMAGYLSDTKELEDAAGIVQNRVRLYLNEKK